ncbi:MAG: hypothetical protein ABSB99_07960 [Acidimicrobiales bacterium]|jgi:hypothetical protein
MRGIPVTTLASAALDRCIVRLDSNRVLAGDDVVVVGACTVVTVVHGQRAGERAHKLSGA